jgi:hypothetical protein
MKVKEGIPDPGPFFSARLFWNLVARVQGVQTVTRRKETVSMKTIFSGIFAGVVLCAVSVAQGTPPAQTNGTAAQSQQSPVTGSSAGTRSGRASGAAGISPGSVIPVQLTRSIDAKKVKTGDEVEAKVTQELKAGNGAVVVPKDTKVVGHVTEAQARNKEQKESQIGIAFDHAIMKNGGDVALPMSIQAIIAPASLNPGDENNGGGESTGQAPSAPGAGGMPGNGSGMPSGRSTGMGTGMPPHGQSSEGTTGAQTNTNNVHQPITGSTQGVLGFSNLKLSTSTDMTQGSVVSSEKGNVKLESGTLMLLRVNQ